MMYFDPLLDIFVNWPILLVDILPVICIGLKKASLVWAVGSVIRQVLIVELQVLA